MNKKLNSKWQKKIHYAKCHYLERYWYSSAKYEKHCLLVIFEKKSRQCFCAYFSLLCFFFWSCKLKIYVCKKKAEERKTRKGSFCLYLLTYTLQENEWNENGNYEACDRNRKQKLASEKQANYIQKCERERCLREYELCCAQTVNKTKNWNQTKKSTQKPISSIYFANVKSFIIIYLHFDKEKPIFFSLLFSFLHVNGVMCKASTFVFSVRKVSIIFVVNMENCF